MVRADNFNRFRSAAVSSVLALAIVMPGHRITAAATERHLEPSRSEELKGRPEVQVPTSHLETGPFIDGAETPELIPDDVAYSLFLRMLLPRAGDADAHFAHQAYLRHTLRQAAALSSASVSPGDVHVRGDDLQAMIRFVGSFKDRVRTFDATRVGLPGEEREETSLVRYIVSTMPTYLGPRLTAALDRYVKEQFKRKVKIIQ